MGTAHRTARRTRVAAAGLLLATALGVAACGSDSATATSDPSPTTTTTTAAPSPTSTTTVAPAPTTSEAPATTEPGGSVDPRSLPTTPVPTTAPTAVPAPGSAGVPAAVQTPAEASFVATLQQNGVQLTPDASTEVNLGQAVCQELGRGGDKQSILVSLLAIGQLAQANGQTSLSAEQYAQLVLTTASNPANCNP